MLTIHRIKLILVFLIATSAIVVVAFSRLWRYPVDNSFLIAFISVPFALFFVPTLLARRSFAHFITVGFLIAAFCMGIVTYSHEAGGPEIPTMYFAIPAIQSIFALLASVVASIDFFVTRRHERLPA